MKIIADTHLHTIHSHDAYDDLASVCEAAIAKGLKVLCSTEHLFLDPRDVGYGYFRLDQYLQAVRTCQDRYGGQLQVLSGVEFSETHLFPEALKHLSDQPIDMIVGALHWLKAGFFGDPKVLAQVPQRHLLADYYKQLLAMVSLGGFDSLAHMDLIKRYVPIDEEEVTGAMKAVLQQLVKHKIALELNTSTIRKDQLETSPSYALVDAYLDLGGCRITVGSDAHSLDAIGACFDQIPSRFYPYIGYFKERRFILADKGKG